VAEEYIHVRLSHLLRHCSVGAIVRGSEGLMVVEDTRHWYADGNTPDDCEIRYVEQVRSALGIKKRLCTPPIAGEPRAGVHRRDGVYGWIPALRFPSWMRCLKCNLLHPKPWRNQEIEDGRCWQFRSSNDVEETDREGKCDGKLEQVPWVMVHEEGHLADVPWHDLAHYGSWNKGRKECKPDWRSPYLKLVIDQSFRYLVECTRCGASDPLPQKAAFPPYAWQQPWINEPPADLGTPEAWLMEINDVRVHAASNRTALVIPPESRIRRGTVVDRLYGSSRNRKDILNARNPLARKTAIRQIAKDYRCTPEAIEGAISEIESGYPMSMYDRSIDGGDLHASEYKALIGVIPDLREDEDFVTEHHTDGWRTLGQTLGDSIDRYIASSVSQLVAVNKLKEIMVLEGFRRVSGKLLPPDIADESDWLPAMDLYGEGIFFTFDEASLQRWECNGALCKRTDDFEKRYVYRAAELPDDAPEISPRLLLCHTLAHVMIRQLESEAGYPAASLRERIYCKANGEPMAGILIYVAVADEEGSLGGLIELAKPERFLRLLVRSFEAARWCSLDPVCSEQEGHGPDLLNRAACHACALVPETSCVYGNVLLDRVFVTGDAAADIPAFLDCVEERS